MTKPPNAMSIGARIMLLRESRLFCANRCNIFILEVTVYKTQEVVNSTMALISRAFRTEFDPQLVHAFALFCSPRTSGTVEISSQMRKDHAHRFNKLREVVDRCVRLLEEYLDTLRSPEISENIKSDMDVLSNRIEESADLLANLARLDEHRTNSCEGFKQLRISPPPSRGHIL